MRWAFISVLVRQINHLFYGIPIPILISSQFDLFCHLRLFPKMYFSSKGSSNYHANVYLCLFKASLILIYKYDKAVAWDEASAKVMGRSNWMAYCSLFGNLNHNKQQRTQFRENIRKFRIRLIDSVDFPVRKSLHSQRSSKRLCAAALSVRRNQIVFKQKTLPFREINCRFNMFGSHIAHTRRSKSSFFFSFGRNHISLGSGCW